MSDTAAAHTPGFLLVGLTGGIASGKTRVADEFAALGAVIIDADVLARLAVRPGSAALDELVARFGSKILQANGSLDRTALRALIFDDASARGFVETVLHPRIRTLADEAITEARSRNERYAIYVVPLLVETGQCDRFDRILLVDVPPTVQVERLMARDHCTRDEALRILATQASRQARQAVADDIIDNEGDAAGLSAQVTDLHRRYLELAMQTTRERARPSSER